MIVKHYSLLILLFLLFFGKNMSSHAQQISNSQSDYKYGFERIRFEFDGREAWYIKPVKPLYGNPWIWRAHFPNWHTKIDSLLLVRGFHIAYINTNNMFGSPVAMQVWDKFYNYLTTEKQFAEKVVLEGVSRGGLYVYGWAKRNPSKVACIYAEAPVCDIKSWPGGKGKSEGDSRQWENLLIQYNITEQEALEYKDNPIDNLEELASFKVPIIHSIGLNDSIVPPEENTFILVNNYIRLGGIATVIPMTKGEQQLQGHHFPIEEPERIVNKIINYYPH